METSLGKIRRTPWSQKSGKRVWGHLEHPRSETYGCPFPGETLLPGDNDLTADVTTEDDWSSINEEGVPARAGHGVTGSDIWFCYFYIPRVAEWQHCQARSGQWNADIRNITTSAALQLCQYCQPVKWSRQKCQSGISTKWSRADSLTKIYGLSPQVTSLFVTSHTLTWLTSSSCSTVHFAPGGLTE